MLQQDKKIMYTVFSIKLANWLIRQGHDMLQAIDSPKDPTGRYKAFLFEDTKELQTDISNYTLINNRRKEITKHVQTTDLFNSNHRRTI